MRKWLCVVIGVVIALWFHASFDKQTTLLDFALAFGLAGAFFLYGAPAPLATAIGVADELALRKGQRWLVVIGTILALAAAAIATMRLWSDLADPLGLLAWGGASLLLLIGWWQPGATRKSTPTDATEKAQPSWFWWLLLGIGLLALLVRLWRIDLYPYGLQSDESNNARDALEWLAGAPYTPYSEANQGQATLFTYLLAVGFKLFGVNALAMRYVSVFVGVATVLSFYFLARTLLSTPAALLSTALLAVSRWHITFSRIIYELIMTPLALIWLFYFLYRGLQERTPRYFVLAGFALAFGFNTYTAFRVVPLGLALLALFWLIADWRRFWGNLGRWLLFALSALIGLLPLLIYALQKPHVIFWRIRELSILDEIAAAGNWEPLWHNLRSYGRMFNLLGDHSNLNNLPNTPMVSWVVGALFVLGLLYALRYWRHLPMFLLLVWIVAVLPAGILSVTVETPSARRVIGLAPLLFLFVGITADALRRATVATWRGQLGFLWPSSAVAVLALFTYTELTLFATQTTDVEVGRAFNISEWSVGSHLATVDTTTTRILLDPVYVDNNIVNFAARNQRYVRLDESRDLPFLPTLQPGSVQADANDLLYVFRPNRDHLRPLLEYFYPQGRWEGHFDPHGMLLFNTFTLPWVVQQQAQGLLTRYYAYSDDDASPTATPLAERIEAAPGDAAPVPPPYHVEWLGSLLAPQHGQYVLEVETPAPFHLLIGTQTFVTTPVTTTLYAGLHAFRLTVNVTDTITTPPQVRWRVPLSQQTDAVAPVFLTMTPPPFGLIGAYYPNTQWEGAPAVVRHDLVVAPNETLPGRPYSVIWQGQLAAPADATYTFGLMADDGALLYIDEQLVVDNGGLHGARYVENQVDLGAGLHAVALHYVQDGGAQALELSWRWADGPRQPLPVAQLSPMVDGVDRLVAAAALVNRIAVPATVVGTTQATPLYAIRDDPLGTFAQPRGVAVGRDGRVYLADTGNRRLVGLAADGAWRFSQNAGDQPFQEPFDLGIDDAGQVYLLDPTAARIDLFTADGVYLRSLPTDPGLVERARGLFVTPQGEVWVAHTAGGRVVHLAADGALVKIIPIADSQPVDVAVDSTGTIYVADVGRSRLLRLTATGQIMAEVTMWPANGVDSPHLAVDAENFLYLTEPETGHIRKISAAGEELLRYKLPTSTMAVVKPIGLAVDGDGRLWTADAEGGGLWRLDLTE